MASPRVYLPNISSDTEECSLVLKVPCDSGLYLEIPFGLAETQIKSQPKPEEQLPKSVAITPLIFMEPSLDKNKAKQIEFIESNDALLKDTSCGYIYIFIDGYLWREYAALGGGALCEVDLKNNHSIDVRHFSAKAVEKLIIPTQAKGLYNGSNLSKTKVEIAFSRVQWSWEYIDLLGGMYLNDIRLALTPLKSKCLNRNKATRLRSERCTPLDFSQSNTIAQIDHIETVENNYAVYLHDRLGIAQRLFVRMDLAWLAMKAEYEISKAQPYYNSAILAYQLYLNESLHEKYKKFVGPHIGYRDQYKENSSKARSLRDVAEHLDPQEIEKMLVSQRSIMALEQYFEEREALLNFYKDYFSTTQLSQHCNQQNISDLPEWHAVIRDISTLPKTSYSSAISSVYAHLNAISQSMTDLPIFIKPITDISKKNNLKQRMSELEQLGSQYIAEVIENSASFVCKQLAADPDAFGKELANAKAKPIKEAKEEEPGVFSPEKWQASFKEITHPNHNFGNTLGLINLTFKQADKMLSELVKFWKKAIKLETNPAVQEIRIKTVGSSLKASGVNPYGEIEIKNFSGIPEGYTVIGVDVTENHLFRGRKFRGNAKKSLDKVIAAIDAGEDIPERSMRSIINNVARESGMTSSIQNGTVVVDRKTGVTVAIQAPQAAREFIQKGLDSRNFMKDLRSLEFKVLVLPKTCIKQSLLAKHYNNLNPFNGTAIRLPSNFNYLDSWMKSNPATFFLIDSILAIQSYQQYEKNFSSKGATYERLKNLSVLASTIVGSAQLYETYISSRTKMSQEVLVKFANQFAEYSHIDRKEILFTRVRVAAMGVGILGGILQISDAYDLYKKNQGMAAATSFMGAGLSIASAIHGAIFVSLGPFGWAFLIGGILCSLVVSYISLTDAEIWAKYGPFGIVPSDKFNGYPAFKEPKNYYTYINSILFSPQISIDRIGLTDNFQIRVNVPLFNNENSTVYLLVSVKRNRTHHKIYTKKYNVPVNRRVEFDRKFVAHIKNPEQILNESGQIIAFNYLAFFNDSYIDMIYAQAQSNVDGITYPQKLINYEKDNFDLKQQDGWVKDRYNIIF